MSDSGNEDITISSDNSNEFQWALIQYALHPERLFFIDNVQFWREFHGVNQINAEKYYDVTPEELCEHFLQEVLPQIDNYDLNEAEENLLRLLALHPGYRRTEDGFVKTNEMESIDWTRDVRETFGNAPADMISGNNVDLNCQVVLGPDYAKRSANELSKENAALLSVALCSDADLPESRLLTTNEMQKGLREAKLLFERTGKQLDNISCSVEDLVAKLKTVCELRDTVAELMRNSFE